MSSRTPAAGSCAADRDHLGSRHLGLDAARLALADRVDDDHDAIASVDELQHIHAKVGPYLVDVAGHLPQALASDIGHRIEVTASRVDDDIVIDVGEGRLAVTLVPGR